MLEYLLPIGSIVRLKDGTKKMMIFGVKQTDLENNKMYDYAGVIYPEGNIGAQYQVLFQHEAIEEVFFRGYENEERTEFISKLEKVLGEPDTRKE